MITLPPYVYDKDIYHLIPEVDRWVVNKLALAEKLGYVCGPCGTDAPNGRYCVRPMMNMYGNAEGGFYEYTVLDQSPVSRRIPNHPGYFWNEWFVGGFTFTEFINDVAVASQEAFTNEDGYNEFQPTNTHLIMPNILKGLSRYMLLEGLGSQIIEASFRHMPGSARQAIIDDYKTIDPTYNPQVEFGLIDGIRRPAKPFIQKGFYWDEVSESRRPFP